MITWVSKTRSLGYVCWCGYVGDPSSLESHKYFVGCYGGRLIADVYDVSGDCWYTIDEPINSVAHGKKLCEMWEATGAY